MQVKDLLVTGNVRVLGNLYTKDGPVGGGSAGGGGGGGDSITYRLTKSGSTITLTGSDGSSSSVTDADTNTTYTLSSLGAAAASHTHTKSQITDFPTSMTPTAHTHTKSQITDFPTSMTPTAHTHTKSQITDFPSSMTPTAHTHAWGEITGKPSTFSPSSHTHDDRYYTESEVNSLLDGKAAFSHNHSASEITSGTLPVARGGTGQTSIDGIKSALGITGGKVESGSYVGSGGSGYNHQVTLTFSFSPKIIIIYGCDSLNISSFMIVSKGSSVGQVHIGEDAYNPYCSWNNNTLSFYYTTALWQMNSSNTTYTYFAIG